jgi:hypothetical protein
MRVREFECVTFNTYQIAYILILEMNEQYLHCMTWYGNNHELPLYMLTLW